MSHEEIELVTATACVDVTCRTCIMMGIKEESGAHFEWREVLQMVVCMKKAVNCTCVHLLCIPSVHVFIELASERRTLFARNFRFFTELPVLLIWVCSTNMLKRRLYCGSLSMCGISDLTRNRHCFLPRHVA